MRAFVREPDHCPWCNYEVDAATGTDREYEAPPVPGDFMICLECGEWAVMGETLRLRKPTSAEYTEIALDNECRQANRAWHEMDRIRRVDRARRAEEESASRDRERARERRSSESSGGRRLQ